MAKSEKKAKALAEPAFAKAQSTGEGQSTSNGQGIGKGYKESEEECISKKGGSG